MSEFLDYLSFVCTIMLIYFAFSYRADWQKMTKRYADVEGKYLRLRQQVNTGKHPVRLYVGGMGDVTVDFVDVKITNDETLKKGECRLELSDAVSDMERGL